MNQYLPFVLLAFVILTGVAGLTLSLDNNVVGNLVVERSCASEKTKDWVNCLTPNGGCPERYPPYKQYGLYIDNAPACCCVPLHSAENFKKVRSLYG
jgi:hypothetical protein